MVDDRSIQNILIETLINALPLREAVLRSITETASYVIGVKAASLYAVDSKSEELVFEVTCGDEGTKLVGTRMPVGKGLAGYTAMTGEAIAVADIEHDRRWAADVADLSGYTPQMILSSPLLIDDRVVGVLQLLDRVDGLMFSPDDIVLAGRFCDQAALSIAQTQSLSDLSSMLRELYETSNTDSSDRFGEDHRFSPAGSGDGTHAEIDQLKVIASLVSRITKHGGDCSRLCIEMLSALDDYLNRINNPLNR